MTPRIPLQVIDFVHVCGTNKLQNKIQYHSHSQQLVMVIVQLAITGTFVTGAVLSS